MNLDTKNNNINFQAKFLKSKSLYDIANYAVEEGKFEKLNKARKNIDKAAVNKRIKVDICYTGENPTVIFTKYEPPQDSSGLFLDEFVPTRQVEYTASKKTNPLKFAFEKIIKLGNNAPQNKMYRELIFAKDEDKSKFLYF